MSWKDKLQASEVDLVQQIVDQVPEAMGVRNAFVNVLDKMATGGGSAPKYRFVVFDENGDVSGTNSADKARDLAKDDQNTVVDTSNSEQLGVVENEDYLIDGDES